MMPREYQALCERLRAERRHGLYCAAVVASAVYNVNRDPEKRKDPITPEEMLGENVLHAARQTPKDMLAMVMALNELHGGKDLRNG